MAEYHTHTTPVVTRDPEDKTGNVLLTIVAIAMIAALIWLFAFSGLVFDRDGSTPPREDTNIEQNFEQPNNPPPGVNQEQQQQQPAPGSS